MGKCFGICDNISCYMKCLQLIQEHTPSQPEGGGSKVQGQSGLHSETLPRERERIPKSQTCLIMGSNSVLFHAITYFMNYLTCSRTK
jgi:hypothetical protein